MSKAPPAVIGGRYRVVRPLGQGGMGSVYEAVDDAGRRVAVKVIMTELANNPTLIGRFEREARAVSAIDTPHIAKAIDAGTDPATGRPFLAMEFLEGEDLEQLLKRLGALPVDLSLRIAAQACMALHKAHEARFLHRDIKPANLFMASQPGGRLIKLLDFGVAKVKPEVTRSASETAGLTRTGSMLGSPLYMSPEQARGYKDIDFRSDLWSLGVVLYKMLSGRTPHADTEELGELIVLICTEPPEPLQDVAPWVSAEVAAVVHRALRFSPAERWKSAAEMLAAIMALLPNGHAITDAMIRPLEESERAPSSRRLNVDLSDAPPPRRPTPPFVPKPDARSLALAAQIGQPVASAQDPFAASSTGAVASTVAPLGPPSGSPGPAAPPRRTTLWVAAGALLASMVGGVAAFRFGPLFSRTAPDSTAAPQPAAPPDSKPRSVAVVIFPEGASVEVDGAAAALNDGVLEITGPIGSVHKVRVIAGGAEKTVPVVVAESGAVPPKIEVEAAAAPGPTATASTAVTATPPIRPKPRPSAAPTASSDLRNKR
jgi:eukaryotic-like serine/threonine-protein kinase